MDSAPLNQCRTSFHVCASLRQAAKKVWRWILRLKSSAARPSTCVQACGKRPKRCGDGFCASKSVPHVLPRVCKHAASGQKGVAMDSAPLNQCRTSFHVCASLRQAAKKVWRWILRLKSSAARPSTCVQACGKRPKRCGDGFCASKSVPHVLPRVCKLAASGQKGVAMDSAPQKQCRTSFHVCASMRQAAKKVWRWILRLKSSAARPSTCVQACGKRPKRCGDGFCASKAVPHVLPRVCKLAASGQKGVAMDSAPQNQCRTSFHVCASLRQAAKKVWRWILRLKSSAARPSTCVQACGKRPKRCGDGFCASKAVPHVLPRVCKHAASGQKGPAMDSAPQKQCRTSFHVCASLRQAAKKVWRWILRLKSSAARPSTCVQACGKRPKRCGDGFCASKSVPHVLPRVCKHAASGQKGVAMDSAPQNQCRTSFHVCASLRQAAKKVWRWILRLKSSAARPSTCVQACGKRPKRCGDGFCASKSVPHVLPRVCKHAASGQKGVAMDSAPQNQCRTSFHVCASLRQAAKKVWRWILRLKSSAARPSTCVQACGKRPKRCGDGFCASKAVPHVLPRVCKHAASGQKGVAMDSAPQNQCRTSFHVCASMRQAAKKVWRWILRLKISAARPSTCVQACGKRPKRCGDGFCASKSVPHVLPRVCKLAASGQKGVAMDSAPQNQCRTSFHVCASLRQAAKKVWRWILRLKISAARPSTCVQACGKRPKRCGDGFCASKSVPHVLPRVCKLAASGQKGVAMDSAPQNQCRTSFHVCASMRQAAKKVWRWILRLKISAARPSTCVQACGKRPKRCGDGFCASKAVPHVLPRVCKHAASGQKGVAMDSAPLNQCRTSFHVCASLRQAAKKVWRWILRLKSSAARPSTCVQACGKRPKRCGDGFCASKAVPHVLPRVCKLAASGQKGVAMDSAPQKQCRTSFHVCASLRQAAKKVCRWILRLKISAARPSTCVQACGKRPKRCGDGFCASKSVPHVLPRVCKLAASGQKGVPMDSAPQNQCRTSFHVCASLRQAAKKVWRWILRLKISAARPSTCVQACGKRPKRSRDGFCASKAVPHVLPRVCKLAVTRSDCRATFC